MKRYLFCQGGRRRRRRQNDTILWRFSCSPWRKNVYGKTPCFYSCSSHQTQILLICNTCRSTLFHPRYQPACPPCLTCTEAVIDDDAECFRISLSGSCTVQTTYTPVAVLLVQHTSNYITDAFKLLRYGGDKQQENSFTQRRGRRTADPAARFSGAHTFQSNRRGALLVHWSVIFSAIWISRGFIFVPKDYESEEILEGISTDCERRRLCLVCRSNFIVKS